VEEGTKVEHLKEHQEYLRQAEAATATELPEYSEYLRRLGLKTLAAPSEALKLKEPPPISDLSFIQPCKIPPAKDDYYGHIFCWAHFALYGMIIFALLIYQIRSIFSLKKKLPTKKESVQETTKSWIERKVEANRLLREEALANGRTDYDQIDGGKPSNSQSVPGKRFLFTCLIISNFRDASRLTAYPVQMSSNIQQQQSSTSTHTIKKVPTGWPFMRTDEITRYSFSIAFI
jgi:hypothetical protein